MLVLGDKVRNPSRTILTPYLVNTILCNDFDLMT